MKWIFRLVLLIIVLFLVAMGISTRLNPILNVERTTTLTAEPYDIFVYMNDLSTFDQWSPWREMILAGDHVLAGPSGGEGQTLAWQSDDPEIGTGSQTIIESFQDSFVRTELNFAGRSAVGTYAISPNDNGTVDALIGIETDLGGFPYIQRLFAKSYASRTGETFDQALQDLGKAVAADIKAYEALIESEQ